jgi:CBS domain-containing protein
VTTAQDVMRIDASHLGPSDSVQQAAVVMRDSGIPQVLVCEADRLVGIVTRRAIVENCVADGRDSGSMPVSDLCRPTEAIVDVGDSLERALIVMAEHRVRGLAVLDEGSFVGVLAQSDVTRALLL